MVFALADAEQLRRALEKQNAFGQRPLDLVSDPITRRAFARAVCSLPREASPRHFFHCMYPDLSRFFWIVFITVSSHELQSGYLQDRDQAYLVGRRDLS